MKVLKIVSLAVILGVLCSLSVLAVNDGFDTDPVPENEANEIFNRFNIISGDQPYDMDNPIVSFDVSDDHRIALGLKDHIIKILNTDGQVLNILTFNSDGVYYIEWSGQNLILYQGRGSLAVEVTLSGELAGMWEINENSIKTAKYWNSLSSRKEIKVDQNTYKLQNKMGVLNLIAGGIYNQLLKIDSDGNTTILYDVNTSRLIKMIIIIIFFIAFFTAVIILVFKKVLAMRK